MTIRLRKTSEEGGTTEARIIPTTITPIANPRAIHNQIWRRREAIGTAPIVEHVLCHAKAIFGKVRRRCLVPWSVGYYAWMRVINRTAVSVTGASPYVEWTRQSDADMAKGMLTVPRAQPYGSVFLLPEFELEEDVQEWIEENVSWLFEFQLAAWTDDESSWPATRDLETFRRWFRVDIHSVVVDVADDEIEGEEL